MKALAASLLVISATAAAAPFTDYRDQRPGAVHRIRPSDLPPPYASKSVDNGPSMIDRPASAWPQAPTGFKVELYASGLKNPRLVRTAPNGDVFVAESRSDLVRVFRGLGSDGKARQSSVFAKGLKKPFGIAFFPPRGEPSWVYVANTDSVVRFPYKSSDLEARGPAQPIAKLPGGGLLRGGGHWTRDVVFSLDGKKMFVSVGSHSNVDDDEDEHHRADILEFNPDGSGERVYAWGIRNPVGLAVNPRTGVVWTSVNERDELGDDLVPEYVTSVKEGGFYGWPWYYIGPNQDPRHKGKRPELKDKVIVPDVLVQPHNASLALTFYEGKQFPAAYRGDLFVAQHGSWNRAARTGYQVIRVPLHQKDRATGEYEDFLTGFVTPEGKVWGRPVGVGVGNDG
ncbi:MAG TPA: PQQ-dependent sugar dehydrogenase, partial [Polyangia bacterium]|nr:PQQ-dependent sugar dehydrogenase [Polyangia bacterium]